MAETPADVKRDIELTRERISDTLQQLEAKTNVMQIVKDHPWPAVGVAFAAGFLLSGSRADVKAASATLVATRGTRSRVGTVLDDVLANLMGGISLVRELLFAGLLDELTLITHPVIAGKGRKLFEPTDPVTRLTLVDEMRTSKGNIVATYARA